MSTGMITLTEVLPFATGMFQVLRFYIVAVMYFLNGPGRQAGAARRQVRRAAGNEPIHLLCQLRDAGTGSLQRVRQRRQHLIRRSLAAGGYAAPDLPGGQRYRAGPAGSGTGDTRDGQYPYNLQRSGVYGTDNS